MKHFLKKILPETLVKKLIKVQTDYRRKNIEKLPKLNKDNFIDLINKNLVKRKYEVVMIHSSLDLLNLDFSILETLDLLKENFGKETTLVFPTFPKGISSKFLQEGNIFNIKRTASFTGILSELARRDKSSIRSLHPTKSVVAIGPKAIELTNNHFESVYPYSKESPFYKICQLDSIIIGLGVKTTYLSAVHVVDDLMPDKFPKDIYLPTIFEAKCLDYNGSERLVSTYAHNMNRMKFDLPKYFSKEIDKSVVEDINLKGMNFFRAEASGMLLQMKTKATNGITIYKY